MGAPANRASVDEGSDLSLKNLAEGLVQRFAFQLSMSDPLRWRRTPQASSNLPR